MKDCLSTYTAEFTAWKADIDYVLGIHTAIKVVELGAKMDGIKAILDTLGHDGRREQEAARLIEMREKMGKGKVLQVRGIHIFCEGEVVLHSNWTKCS